MTRWKDYSKYHHYFQLLGKLGSMVDFKGLPSSVQTAGTAEAFGARAEDTVGDAMACGSPGEVGNDPSLGHRYSMKLFGEQTTGAERYLDAVTQSALYQPYQEQSL